MRRIGLLLIAGIVVAAVAATPGVAAKKFHMFFPGHKAVEVDYTFNGSTWPCFVTHKETGQYPGNPPPGGYALDLCDETPGAVGSAPVMFSGTPTGAFPPFGSFGWFSDW